jgi:hypothetical protein
LGDSGLVTNAEPAPVFRRFPWVQLVFCLACLSMAAWTWIASYCCWQVTPDQLVEGAPRIWFAPLLGLYVDVSVPKDFQLDPYPDNLISAGVDPTFTLRRNRSGELRMQFSNRHYRMIQARGLRLGSSVRGRIVQAAPPSGRALVGVDTRSPRISGSAIAGLVVGAMGCFIFGLYLRRWLKARREAT